jgi:hypothetical protein
MKRLFSVLMVWVVAACGASPAQASVAGTYWNPAQPGLGWAFEVQNDIVFALQYAYEGSAVQPTFRSCIGTVGYQVLGDGHVRETMSGDCYRTENFNQTVRTGPFSAVYEFGRISLNAAGFVQSNLVPFDFGFDTGIAAINGVWLISTLPLSGTGQSVTATFSTTTGQTSGGIPTRVYVTSDGQVGLLAYFAAQRQYIALSSLTVGQPANTLQMYTFPLRSLRLRPAARAGKRGRARRYRLSGVDDHQPVLDHVARSDRQVAGQQPRRAGGAAGVLPLVRATGGGDRVGEGALGDAGSVRVPGDRAATAGGAPSSGRSDRADGRGVAVGTGLVSAGS